MFTYHWHIKLLKIIIDVLILNWLTCQSLNTKFNFISIHFCLRLSLLLKSIYFFLFVPILLDTFNITFRDSHQTYDISSCCDPMKSIICFNFKLSFYVDACCIIFHFCSILANSNFTSSNGFMHYIAVIGHLLNYPF